MRVIDTDPASVEKCRLNDVPAFLENAISVHPRGDEGVVCFNLILHHLVSDSEEQTFQLQKKALELWKNQKTKLFVNEYIYDSYLKNSSGWLIYQITSSRFLSAIGLFFSKFSSSLRANTFGVGVRFRSHEEWKKMFREAGFAVIGTALGAEEQISMPRRLLLIKSIRKDSFLLEGNMIS